MLWLWLVQVLCTTFIRVHEVVVCSNSFSRVGIAAFLYTRNRQQGKVVMIVVMVVVVVVMMTMMMRGREG
ncbi:hypothetical protein EDD21DRAFT_385859 [Dissophora ornata]|nr:hypothetical protein EDD21DRAFT_385859 [Dissophora ornata]